MSREMSRTVLVVEDDPDSREMFFELLRGGGYAVVASRNGKDAMAYLSVNPVPDVILLDMFMPEMDGWQFRRAQDADPRLSAVPVVVVSAVGAARNSAVQSGAAAFLPKPVAADDLLRALQLLWTTHAPAEEPAAKEDVPGTGPAEALPDSANALAPAPPVRPV